MSKKLAHLLRDLALLRRYRARRGERLPFRIRLPFERNRIRVDAHQAWPGGYVFNEAGQLVYVPRPVDVMGGYRLLKPAVPPPLVGALCKPGDVFVDVGANIGSWTLAAARAVGPQGTVIAVEPLPHMAEALRRTARANRLAQVRVAELALAEAGGTRPFSVERGNSGGSRLGLMDNDPEREFSAITVRTAPLDEVAREHRLARMDVVKIDVEGFESDVLAGAGGCLERFSPAIVMEAGHDDVHRRERSHAILREHGYEVVGVLLGEGLVDATLADYGARSGVFADYPVVDVLLMRQEKR
jgi:FkbM family methyltransferase